MLSSCHASNQAKRKLQPAELGNDSTRLESQHPPLLLRQLHLANRSLGGAKRYMRAIQRESVTR